MALVSIYHRTNALTDRGTYAWVLLDEYDRGFTLDPTLLDGLPLPASALFDDPRHRRDAPTVETAFWGGRGDTLVPITSVSLLRQGVGTTTLETARIGHRLRFSVADMVTLLELRDDLATATDRVPAVAA